MTKKQKSKLASDMLWHYLLAAEVLPETSSYYPDVFNLLWDLEVHRGLCRLYSSFRMEDPWPDVFPFRGPNGESPGDYWWPEVVRMTYENLTKEKVMRRLRPRIKFLASKL